MASLHTVVAAVDFSDISAEVLDTARDMARLHQARLHVVHAVGDPFRSMYAVESSGLDLPDVLREWTEAARKELAILVAQHPVEPGQLTTAVLSGTPAHAIVRYADEQKADLIVIGSHGRGVVSRLLLGSVAERVLHLAGCPVFLVSHRARRVASLEARAAAAVGG